MRHPREQVTLLRAWAGDRRKSDSKDGAEHTVRQQATAAQSSANREICRTVGVGRQDFALIGVRSLLAVKSGHLGNTRGAWTHTTSMLTATRHVRGRQGHSYVEMWS